MKACTVIHAIPLLTLAKSQGLASILLFGFFSYGMD